MITIRKMKSSEKSLISEIDITEKIKNIYKCKNGQLETLVVNWNIDQWDSKKKIEEWNPIAENYSSMWGAFDNEKLIGFSVYRANLTDNMAQFAILHISQNYRNKGIGKKLANKVIEKAKTDGKNKIYLTASPAKSTVDFYLNLGFKLTTEINEELYKLEPDDMHMIMESYR